MIKNIPSVTNYEEVGKDCILQAFSLIYNSFEKGDSSELIKYHQRTLRNTIILIHQGLEILMKAEICKKSPLLIIENKRREWSTLPGSPSKDFSDLYTISGDELLRTFFAIEEIFNGLEERTKFVQFYNDIKKHRNLLMHGISNDSLEPKKKIKLCLESLFYFYGKTRWIDILMQDIKSNPSFNNNEEGQYEYELYNRLSFIENLLCRADINLLLDRKLYRHRDNCPNCLAKMVNISDNLVADWTYIKGKKIICMVCNKESEQPNSIYRQLALSEE